MKYFEEPKIIDSLKPVQSEKTSSMEVDSVYKQRELLKNAINKAKDLVADLENIPDKIKPAIRLYFFNNIIARKGKEPENGYDQEIQDVLNRFKVYIDDEKNAEESKILPTIGTEIEIPDKFKEFTIEDYDLFYATEDLGIPAGKDVRYEFAPQYSYSAKSQSILVHELIRGGFIETKSQDGKKEIRGEGDFPLHINLGFPAHYITKENKEKFEQSADSLVNALTYAFSSYERLKKRTDKFRFKTRPAENPESINQAGSAKDVGKEWQRLEIRSLEVRDSTLYRLLSETQLLGVALFSNFYHEDLRQKNLKNIWQDFEEKVNDIIKEYHLDYNDIDDSKLKSRLILKYSQLSDKMRNLITDSSLLIRQVLREDPELSSSKIAA